MVMREHQGRAEEPRKPTLEFLGETPAVASAYLYGNVVFLIWLDAATVGAVSQLKQAAQGLVDRGVTPVSVIQWLTAGRPMPDSQARSALVEMLQGFQPNMACSAVILNGGGFWAGAIRATINGIRMLVPGRLDLRVETSLSATMAWLPEEHASRTGVRLLGSGIEQALLRAVERSGSPVSNA